MAYGFPSGVGLRVKILALRKLLDDTQRLPLDTTDGLWAAEDTIIKHNKAVASAGLYPILKQGFDQDQLKDFLDEFSASQQSSIDAFLEHRREFIDIGKVVIAYCLISCERDENLFMDKVNLSWYAELLNRMDAPFDDFDKNQLSIVTFNYDRSLEHFLFTALKSRYGRKDDEVAKKLAAIPIVHVHGQLGYLNWQMDSKTYSRKYDPVLNTDIVDTAATGIKIICEGIEGTSELQAAYDLLAEAEQIHFLGFSYHHTSMRRIMVPLDSGHGGYGKAGRFISGTCKGFTKEQAARLKSKYPGLSLLDKDILKYLTCCPQLLEASDPK